MTWKFLKGVPMKTYFLLTTPNKHIMTECSSVEALSKSHDLLSQLLVVAASFVEQAFQIQRLYNNCFVYAFVLTGLGVSRRNHTK